MAIIIPSKKKIDPRALAAEVKNNTRPAAKDEAPKKVDPGRKATEAELALIAQQRNSPSYIANMVKQGYNPSNIANLPKPILTTNSEKLTVSNEEKASARDKLRALSVSNSKKQALSEVSDDDTDTSLNQDAGDEVNQQGNIQQDNQGADPFQYNGMSFDQYKQSLIDSVRAGVMTEYEANANIIRNNLAQAMSALQNELAALEPLYQTQLDSIAKNQYATGERTKEMLNQSGWNTSNSGLAVGEHTRIANAADESRAEAGLAKTQAEENINRQRTLQKQLANNDLDSLEAQKNAKLSVAETEALIQAEDRYRQMYESDRAFNFQQKQFSESIRQFNEQLKETRANRSASEKAAAAQAEAALDSAQKDTLYNEALSTIYKQTTQQGVYNALKTFMSDTGIPDSVKSKLLKDAEAMIKMINADGTVYNPNSGGINWTE